MTPIQLAEIKQRETQVTQGPWHIGWTDENDESAEIDSFEGLEIALVQKRANQAFIASSRTDIPNLIQALEEAWEDIKFLQEQLEAYQPDFKPMPRLVGRPFCEVESPRIYKINKDNTLIKICPDCGRDMENSGPHWLCDDCHSSWKPVKNIEAEKKEPR